MGLNDTPTANRIHIGFFGCRNVGKSSLVNAVTGQDLAVVSDVAGTTTDPVYKSMELLPLGPVVITDTPGIDDTGKLGELRIKKTRQELSRIDVAVLVVDVTRGLVDADRELIDIFREKNINYIIAYNKSDATEGLRDKCGKTQDRCIWVSAKQRLGIQELKELIGSLVSTDTLTRRLVGDLVDPGDVVLLVIPIDSAAPKGRLILPQQQVIRDVLESGGVALVCRDTELADTLDRYSDRVSLVVTDSQVFGKVMRLVPDDIYMTSFSILMARFKGQLAGAVEGATVLDTFKKKNESGRILISEGCTHHRQCDDIGTVKLPKWIDDYTGCHQKYEFTSGTEFPDDLGNYDLVIHCGGCMLNEREMRCRQSRAEEQGVPMTNYGTAIAYMNGILQRSLRVFKGNYDMR